MLFKKLILFILVAIVVVIALSCGGGEKFDDPGKSNAPSENPTSSPPAESPTTTLTESTGGENLHWIIRLAAEGVAQQGLSRKRYARYVCYLAEIPEEQHLESIGPSFESALKSLELTEDFEERGLVITSVITVETLHYYTIRRETEVHMEVPVRCIVIATSPSE